MTRLPNSNPRRVMRSVFASSARRNRAWPVRAFTSLSNWLIRRLAICVTLTLTLFWMATLTWAAAFPKWSEPR